MKNITQNESNETKTKSAEVQMTGEEILAKAKTEGEAFAAAVFNAGYDGRLYTEFSKEMHKAINHGRICTPERMAVLYPIFREINLEKDSINAYWADIRRKEERKEERKNRKLKSEAKNEK